MKQIRQLQVQFDIPIKGYEITKFRGAIINLLENKEQEDLFHQHFENQMIYRYPLIQYKQIGGKPTLISYNEGSDQIHKIFGNGATELNIGETNYPFIIHKIRPGIHVFQVWESTFKYKLLRWLPLQGTKYVDYQKMTGLVQKIALLEKILIGNMLSMAKGMEWHVNKKISVTITKINIERGMMLKGIMMKAFDVEFETNVSLPWGIGLGKSCSIGHGVIIPINEEKK